MRWAELTARQQCCADSMSLNANAIPAAREPGPLVTRCRSRTVAKVDSIGVVVRRWIRIALRHILPNALAPIIASGTLLFATNLTAEAAITFLRLGIQPPTP